MADELTKALKEAAAATKAAKEATKAAKAATEEAKAATKEAKAATKAASGAVSSPKAAKSWRHGGRIEGPPSWRLYGQKLKEEGRRRTRKPASMKARE